MNNIIVGMGEALWDVLPEGKKIGGAPASSFFWNIQIVWELFLSVLFIRNWLPVIFVWLR